MVKWTALALILGFLIDLLLGDPRWLYHPVRIIGNGISLLEKYSGVCFQKPRGGEDSRIFSCSAYLYRKRRSSVSASVSGLPYPHGSGDRPGNLHVLSDAGSEVSEGGKYACV